MSKLDIEFDGDEDEKIDALKTAYGIKQTTELVRFLITINYQIRNVPITVVLTQLAAAASNAAASPTQK